MTEKEWARMVDGMKQTIVQTIVLDEVDAFCEEHGHAQGCPHDPTDWDTLTKEAFL